MPASIPTPPLGKLFGRWTFLGKEIRKFPRRLLCRCECGRRRWVPLGALRSGATRGCFGCRRWATTRPVAGQKYGLWTTTGRERRVRSPCGQTKRQAECRCECGARRWVIGYHLRDGVSRGCHSCRVRARGPLVRYRGREGKLADVAQTVGLPYQTLLSRWRAGIRDEALMRPRHACRVCLKRDHSTRTHATADLTARLRREHPGVSRQRIFQLRNRALGLCVSCSRPAVHWGRCERHAA